MSLFDLRTVQLLFACLISLLFGFLIGFLALRKTAYHMEMKRMLKLQDQFVALGSHYLLTPISTIQAAVSRLQESESMGLESRRRMYEVILQGESRLWIIAQQLILMNQFSTDRFQLEIAAINISDLVLEAIQALDPLARKAKVTLSFEDTTLGNSQVRADRRRLKQAFIAVIDNAIKFSPEESEVKIALGTTHQQCQLVIADAGTGMPSEVLDHVSEKFYRGTNLYQFDYEGMGLGMHIAKRIISLHQGIIRIESAPKSGTRVSIEFPKL